MRVHLARAAAVVIATLACGGQTFAQGLKIVEDPGIQRGGCLLETSFGNVDATIDGQLGCVADQIWKIFEETGPPLSPPS